MVSKTIFYILFTAWPWPALLARFRRRLYWYAVALKTTRSGFTRGKKEKRGSDKDPRQKTEKKKPE